MATRKSTARPAVSKPRTTTTKPKTKSTTVVKLYELDPNSGPVDVPQKIVLFGEGIDPSRVKAKFGTQPSVFLKALTTVCEFISFIHIVFFMIHVN